MDTAKRGCVPMRLLDAGIGGVSKSVNRRAEFVISSRMLALGHLGVIFGTAFYGNEMTWDQFASLWLMHGNEAQIKYGSLQDGWRYEFDAYGGRFLVTDENGLVYVTKAKTLADLGVVWDILCSRQFRVFYTGTFINDAFLVAWHKRKWDQDGPVEEWEDNLLQAASPYLAYIDQYYTDIQRHWRLQRFAAASLDSVQLTNDLTQEIHIDKTRFTALRNTPPREARGDYTETTVLSEKERLARTAKRRKAYRSKVFGEFLLIALFASIANRSKPVAEPWMLWGIWKWIGKSRPIESKDKIFDLSPNWG